MGMRHAMAAAVLAVAGVTAWPAAQAAVVGVSVRIAPPPMRYERVAVRPGYAWAPGYWRWNGRRHVWVGGHYVRVRPGYAYVGPRWYRHGPDWRFHDGYWARR
ncbi:YXWGXW repeat-containing protein [Lysobacter silvisoli]|uniref:BcpO-related WXXGXW repeat protein n=1 Tax=Lysobacter silvisoli TaxID=2293254 RepID=A0A371K2R5_9GAMM|nr:YXWGXW repeat-containing protein [Lysobacter silvisoli]RDZ28137.1 hypothetical protein DX914_03055 [Lysobacter silvisoli]